ncbi:hypothetical protein R69619_07873 [Paraburkholderia nemoris]|jgi:hypothetical protein|nr:hypothetical protein R75777_00621 [Paraburkholderia nemoris]CAE6860313.1 hypothetical protein R69619_07873 [Paraburkholderia nemoris]
MSMFRGFRMSGGKPFDKRETQRRSLRLWYV